MLNSCNVPKLMFKL